MGREGCSGRFFARPFGSRESRCTRWRFGRLSQGFGIPDLTRHPNIRAPLRDYDGTPRASTGREDAQPPDDLQEPLLFTSSCVGAPAVRHGADGGGEVTKDARDACSQERVDREERVRVLEGGDALQ